MRTLSRKKSVYCIKLSACLMSDFSRVPAETTQSQSPLDSQLSGKMTDCFSALPLKRLSGRAHKPLLKIVVRNPGGVVCRRRTKISCHKSSVKLLNQAKHDSKHQN